MAALPVAVRPQNFSANRIDPVDVLPRPGGATPSQRGRHHDQVILSAHFYYNGPTYPTLPDRASDFHLTSPVSLS